MAAMVKIGLLGGGFDPVHNGHLSVAETVRKKMNLSRVLLIPAAVPPLKETTAPFADRFEMLRLALSGRHGLEVSPMEAERRGPSYTVDTLHILRKEFGSHGELFFITGFDAFSEIKLWKDYNVLLRLASFVVVDRPSHNRQSLEEFCARELFDVFPAGDDAWQVKGGKKIYRVQMEPVSISSTEIRKRLRDGRTINGLVPKEVENYIHRNKLYMV